MTLITTTEEIKAANSAVAHDLSFASISSYVDGVSENTMIRAMGRETYLLIGAGTDAAVEIAKALAKRAEANLAVSAYAAFGSVQLGENGATVFQSDNYRIASDKKVTVLIEQSAMIGTRALEGLLKHFEAHLDIFSVYADSPERKENRSLFINSTEEFNRAQFIDDNVLLFRSLRTFIRDAEQQYIEPLLGDEYTETLRAAVFSNNCSSIQAGLIENIARAVAQYAIADAIRYNTVKLDANGVFTNTVGASAGQANTEKQAAGDVDRLAMALTIACKKGDNAMGRLRRFIAKNKDALTGIREFTGLTRLNLNDENRGFYYV